MTAFTAEAARLKVRLPPSSDRWPATASAPCQNTSAAKPSARA